MSDLISRDDALKICLDAIALRQRQLASGFLDANGHHRIRWTAGKVQAEVLADEIRALPAAAQVLAPALGVRAKPLVWDCDSRRLRMDETMLMSKAYDFDTMEITRQEGYGLGCGYLIWAIRAHNGGKSWNMYGTFDGLFIQDISDERAAKAAAQTDYDARIRAALEPAPADTLGADWMREAAALGVEMKGWPTYGDSRRVATAIRAIPSPTPADVLDHALRLPEVARLKRALEITRNRLNSFAHDQFDGVWNEADFVNETKVADAALAALEGGEG